MDKKKIYDFSKKYLNATNVKIAILFIPLLVIIIKDIKSGQFVLNDFYDTSILISFLIVFICESIASGLSWYIEKKTEDDVKLARDYKALVNKYSIEKEHMVCWDNGEKYIPAIVLCDRRITSNSEFNITIEKDTSKSRYILPKQIADNSGTLFNAHSHSIVYNNINIRLNDLIVDGNCIKLLYGFTTYYDSLITNRAVDYPFKGNRTVREVYEPGPFLNKLCDSKLSNHLGFNGFVELSDGKIIFVKRGNNLSIGKGMWQQSIGASLKTQYCINPQYEMDANGLSNAMRMEIMDELKIEIDSDEMLIKTIFAFYRDLVEGGKPQFLFYYKTNEYDEKTFIENFNKKKSNKHAKKNKRLVEDGKEFEFLSIEELKKCEYDVDAMTTSDGKKFKMMPSSIASVILLIKNVG